MTMKHLPETYPNPDLEIVGAPNALTTNAPATTTPAPTAPATNTPAPNAPDANWHLPANRRGSLQRFSRLHRYGLTFRAARVLRLTPTPSSDSRHAVIAQLPSVKKLIADPSFTAMGVARGNHILFESYAPDYPRDEPHSLQSITKTMVHMMVGRALADGLIALDQEIKSIIPELGSGYDHATIQQLLNMDVENDYNENQATLDYYEHSEAMGWQLPKNPNQEVLQRDFLCRIQNTNQTPPTPYAKYKDANTDVLAWAVERVSKRPLRQHLADIVDAAGIEGQMAMSCDRHGVPVMDGGACLTLRDLLRYGLLLSRGGVGVDGKMVGNKDFTQQTLTAKGVAWAGIDDYRYANHTQTNGRALAHAGYGGQYLFADITSGIVIGFFSLAQDNDATNHYKAIWDMMVEVAALAK